MAADRWSENRLQQADIAKLAQALAQAALAGKAEDLLLLKVDELTTLADYFLICSGTSDRHLRSMAQRIEEGGRALGRKPLAREGERQGRWVLLDYGDVIVHLFDQPTREYFNIAQLWADAPRVTVEEPLIAVSEADGPDSA